MRTFGSILQYISKGSLHIQKGHNQSFSWVYMYMLCMCSHHSNYRKRRSPDDLCPVPVLTKVCPLCRKIENKFVKEKIVCPTAGKQNTRGVSRLCADLGNVNVLWLHFGA